MSIRIMVALENTIFTAGDILKGEVIIASSNIVTEILEIIINLKVLENVVLEGKRESLRDSRNQTSFSALLFLQSFLLFPSFFSRILEVSFPFL